MKKTKLTLILTTAICSALLMISCETKESTDSKGNSDSITTEAPSQNEDKALETNNSSNKDSSNKTEGNSTTKTEKGSTNKTEGNSVNTHEIFYGKWTISKVSQYGKVSALSKEDIDALIGQSIEFSKSSVVFKGVSYDKPTYSFGDMNSEMFASEFKGLSLDSDKITTVEIENCNDIPGCVITTKEGSVMMYIEGVLFELARQ